MSYKSNTLLDLIVEGVFILDSEFRILCWNRRMEEWTGQAFDEIFNSKITDLWPELGSKKFRVRLQQIFKGGAPQIFSSQLHGAVIPIQLIRGAMVQHTVVRPLKVEGCSEFHAFFSVSDVTELTQSLEKVKKASNEVRRLAELKDVFLSNMSHEIRTPLAGMIGLAHMLEETGLNEAQQKLVRYMLDCGENLVAVLNDILDFAKLDQGKVQLEDQDFDLRECLTRNQKLFDKPSTSQDLKWVLNVDPQFSKIIRCDQARLSQIFLNLMSNAVKFTKHGLIEVSVRKVKKGVLEAIVSDTGIGMEEEVISILFQRFQQGDKTIARRFGGTGLGLSICQKLVGLMGGDIQVESKKGQGTRFTFQVQFRDPNLEESLEAPEIRSCSLEGMRILVAEDNSVNAKIITHILKSNGMKVELAINGLEAVQKVQEGSFDLIFMDMMMPQMDGPTATKEIIKSSGGKHPPIVALTANVQEVDRQICLKAGMSDFLPKPIRKADVITMLNRLLC